MRCLAEERPSQPRTKSVGQALSQDWADVRDVVQILVLGLSLGLV